MSSHSEPTGQPLPDMNENGAGGNRGVKAQISEFAQSAKQQAASAVAPIRDNARTFAEEQKQRGAGRIDSIAEVVHNAAEEIGREIPPAAEYVHAAADQLQRASSLLRDNSVEDLVQMAVEFAEERPILFVSGTVAAGFLLTRFLRSSTAGFGESEEE